MTGAVSSHPQ